MTHTRTLTRFPTDQEHALIWRGFTPAEARLLAVMLRRSPHVASMQELTSELAAVGRGSLHVHIPRIRRMLLAMNGPRDAIDTFKDEGYRLSATAAAFLRQQVPDAFPATKEPSR